MVVYRQLDEAQLSGDSSTITEAIRILDVERETTKLVCEQLPDRPLLTAPRATNITSDDAAAVLHQEQASAPKGAATYGNIATPPSTSMSFEA